YAVWARLIRCELKLGCSPTTVLHLDVARRTQFRSRGCAAWIRVRGGSTLENEQLANYFGAAGHRCVRLAL
ncbi:MAG TPA: hypothetical protein VIV60_29305, partial [Polyangiaceae bacterium]